MNNYDLTKYDPQFIHSNLIGRDLICRYRLIPLEHVQDTLYVGLAELMDQHTLDAISFQAGIKVLPVIVSKHLLDTILNKYCSDMTPCNYLELSARGISNNNFTFKVNPNNNDEPLIQFVDYIIQQAIQLTASDIHIEPFANHCRIRYRCDGVLHEIANISIDSASRVTSRLKILAKLDIAERRLPQDGHFQLQNMDIRINTCPTIFGEKIVLRLLDINKFTIDLNKLGLNEAQKQLLVTKISESHGCILVTGPTGCGKTLTLYSILNYLNKNNINISTVEDPVEIQLPGVNQVNIHSKIGLSFSIILRTLLRQDPDIIMVGEIRDEETAAISIQAAQTGHLVLSTLHTNSAIETVMRLKAMGVSAYNISCSISLIIAQRLVRKLCDQCKQPQLETLPSQTFGLDLKNHTIYEPVGCNQCIHGYKGRTGIFELLSLTDDVSENILSNSSNTILKNIALNKGFQLLSQTGMEKVLAGITSIAEINRVI